MPKRTDIEKILIIGSGPIVIGQAAEFDYSGTQALKALKRAGYRLVVVNSNSATIMTDPELSDAVYIEPLTVEFLEAIIAQERPEALLPTLGGQTALNLAVALAESGVLDRYGVELIGALFETIRRAEDRELFKETMLSIGLDVPRSQQVGSLHEAFAVAEELGYPLLIRPSYILGGRAVEIVDTPEELRHYVAEAARISPGYLVLVDRFLDHALEMDVDILTDGQNVWVAGLMEQIEEAGVHSGDSACVLPPVSLSEGMVGRIEDAVVRLVRAMGAVGLLNIQMAIKGNELFVLEANPRASRTVPFVSKAIGIPVAKLAAKVLVGKSLRELLSPYWPFPVHLGSPYQNGNLEEILDATHQAPTPWPEHSSVKEVVLPFGRFPGCDVLLGPEMRSTGEVMSFGESFPESFAKAQIAAGNPIPTEGAVLVSLADSDKREGIALVSHLYDWGFDIVATQGNPFICFVHHILPKRNRGLQCNPLDLIATYLWAGAKVGT